MNFSTMAKKPWRLYSLDLDALQLDSNHRLVDRWVFPTWDKGFEAFFAAVDKLSKERDIRADYSWVGSLRTTAG